jgi:hypothetical protein
MENLQDKIKEALEESRNGRKEALDLLAAMADQAIAETRNHLEANGGESDLSEWVTIKAYCKRFGIADAQLVLDGIKRGIVPAEDTMVLEDMNHIRMIRAKEYFWGENND